MSEKRGVSKKTVIVKHPVDEDDEFVSTRPVCFATGKNHLGIALLVQMVRIENG